MRKIIMICCGIIFLSGCTVRMVDFTIISTKNVEASSIAKGERVIGQDCVPVIFFPWGKPNMKEAIDRAIEQAGPEYDALIDGVLYQLNQAFFFGRICYRVEGTPINTKSEVSLNDKQRNNMMVHSKSLSGNEHGVL